MDIVPERALFEIDSSVGKRDTDCVAETEVTEESC